MKKLLIIIVCSLVVTLHAFAQLNPVSVINAGTGLGKSIFGNIKDKKKQKSIQSSLSQIEINGSILQILRVPEEKIVSDGKGYIIKIQNQLDQYHKLYKENRHIEIPYYNDDITVLKSVDADWPVEFYNTELKEYKIFDQQLTKNEQRVNDSLEKLVRIRQRRIDDSLMVVKKYQTDSLEYTRRTEGYHFVNREFALLKDKPTEKSKTIGKLFVGSYIKIIGYSDNSPFLKISFQNIEGFINKSDIVDAIDKIDVPNANIATYKSRQYYKYEPNYEYVSEEATSYSAPLKSTSSKVGTTSTKKKITNQQRTYITGPRGGCYYLTSSGNKVYVDRSYCQ